MPCSWVRIWTQGLPDMHSLVDHSRPRFITRLLHAATSPFGLSHSTSSLRPDIWLLWTPLYTSKSELLVMIGIICLLFLFPSELNADTSQLPQAIFHFLYFSFCEFQSLDSTLSRQLRIPDLHNLVCLHSFEKQESWCSYCGMLIFWVSDNAGGKSAFWSIFNHCHSIWGSRYRTFTCLAEKLLICRINYS